MWCPGKVLNWEVVMQTRILNMLAQNLTHEEKLSSGCAFILECRSVASTDTKYQEESYLDPWGFEVTRLGKHCVTKGSKRTAVGGGRNSVPALSWFSLWVWFGQDARVPRYMM